MEGEHDRPTLPRRPQWRCGERPFSFRLHLRAPSPRPSLRPSVTVASDRQRVRPLDRPPADAAVVRVRPSVRSSAQLDVGRARSGAARAPTQRARERGERICAAAAFS